MTQSNYESPPVPGFPVSAVPTPGAVSDRKPEQDVKSETPEETEQEAPQNVDEGPDAA